MKHLSVAAFLLFAACSTATTGGEFDQAKLDAALAAAMQAESGTAASIASPSEFDATTPLRISVSLLEQQPDGSWRVGDDPALAPVR
jgi:hypothetical protein